MAITPTTSATGTAAAGTGTSAATRGGMGKEDFMKLLVAQLKHQDPTAPTDMNGMTAQMTQFSMLEQMTNLAKSGDATSSSLARTEALGLLGRTVSWVEKDSGAQTGKVENVDVSADKPTLTIDGAAGILATQLKSIK